MMLSDSLSNFYQSLQPPENLPKDIGILFPQQDPGIMELVKKFFDTYFNDSSQRHLMLGINPGRYGAGITGINFTAPRQLKENCRIDHSLKLSSELSAEFIYDMIGEYGGVKKFYTDWFISAVCPLGFVTSSAPGSTPNPFKGGDATHKAKGGKNINYYDDKK